MIIGDSDQCLSLEKNCYESSSILKRKLSDEVGENSTISNRIYLNEATQVTQMSSNDKIHYINNLSTDQNVEYSYHSKVVDEIHQEGHQSFINLTVLTPSSANLQVAGQSTNHENTFLSQNHHQPIQQRDHEIKMPTSTVSTAKFGGNMKNFQNQTGNPVVIKLHSECDKVAKIKRLRNNRYFNRRELTLSCVSTIFDDDQVACF